MFVTTKYCSIIELGQRSNQEDCIYPGLGEHIDNNDLFILCDGMGGHDNGEVASSAVCKAMSEYILKNPDTDFESALNAAFDSLDEHDTGAEKKMGTTMTFVKFDSDTCIVAHIGDSRVYQIRPSEKKILFVTKDHSLINDLVACGELSEEEARHSNQKNVITRAMLPHQEKRVKADVTLLTDIKAGDYFFMCSDGMLEVSEDTDIVNILSMNIPDEEKMEILRGVTKYNKDNHSAHIIHVLSVEDSKPHATKEGQIKNNSKIKNKRWLFIMVASIIALSLLFWQYSKKMNDRARSNETPVQTVRKQNNREMTKPVPIPKGADSEN